VTSGLWHDHPATPRQEQFAFKTSRKRARPTQADVIVELLREKRALGKPLELPEIMAVGIAQHGARLNELRSRRFCDPQPNGTRHDPERDGGQP
jgi:hypothetical protein